MSIYTLNSKKVNERINSVMNKSHNFGKKKKKRVRRKITCVYLFKLPLHCNNERINSVSYQLCAEVFELLFFESILKQCGVILKS